MCGGGGWWWLEGHQDREGSSVLYPVKHMRQSLSRRWEVIPRLKHRTSPYQDAGHQLPQVCPSPPPHTHTCCDVRHEREVLHQAAALALGSVGGAQHAPLARVQRTRAAHLSRWGGEWE